MGALDHRIAPVKAELTSIGVGNALVRACGVFTRPNFSYALTLSV